ncbi:sigma-70 family RNA polymerase sigma factor [Actinomadura soli]|uniref:Sigma-70 family RNA polymerase sigma factor n=1 Tax=Actinomadura soli TaxID=2508997 RepID=A0A5C4J6W9_9ACTN|nr:sigma-70 family RNA polymerase sigma factor [Actinomadura soli]TMQ92729.1 sigma-70 family RNA polymerase sigma factor [Actinomadura soli]
MSNHQINEQTNEHRPAYAATGQRSSNALTVAERSFVLLTTGPDPLAIEGSVVGHGLPARPVDLRELRSVLLDRASSDELKDAVWRHLVRQARTGDPAWIVGCAGVAMPGLKSTAARVIRSSPSRLADDIVSELLTEFIAQLARIDIQRPHIAARLMLWARKGALRARGRETRDVPCDPSELPAPASISEVDPIELLLDATRQGIINPAVAELIIATRLDGLSIRKLAEHRGMPASRLYKQRQTAELRLVTAIREGRISAMPVAPAF